MDQQQWRTIYPTITKMRPDYRSEAGKPARYGRVILTSQMWSLALSWFIIKNDCDKKNPAKRQALTGRNLPLTTIMVAKRKHNIAVIMVAISCSSNLSVSINYLNLIYFVLFFIMPTILRPLCRICRDRSLTMIHFCVQQFRLNLLFLSRMGN